MGGMFRFEYIMDNITKGGVEVMPKSKEKMLADLLDKWDHMAAKYARHMVKYLNKYARLEVWRWYSTYIPKYYKRRKTLYYGFEIKEISSGVIKIHFGPELMYKYHRVDKKDPEYIFENSFMQGFHGGATNGPDHPAPGIPFWRTPYPEYTDWGWPAAKNISPYIRINKKFDEFELQTKKRLFNEFKHKIWPQLNYLIKMREED